jgi:hypothetical protein
MTTYEIITLETVPTIKKYVYTVEASSREDAERKFRDGLTDHVSFIKDVDTLEVTETDIQDITEVN